MNLSAQLKIVLRFATLLLVLTLTACSQNVTAPPLETQAADPFGLNERTEPSCDVIIGLRQNYVRAKDVNYEPGDTICLEAGKRPQQQFVGFKGTPAKPLTFINKGGRVLIGGPTSDRGLIFLDSNHFTLSGTGTSKHVYGVQVVGTTGSATGIDFKDRSDNFEVEFVKVANTGFAGIMAKSDDTNQGVPQSQRWVMRNISIHDTYIHDTRGEGMYIGQTVTNSASHDIRGVRVYDNVVTRTRWDGFQIANANQDVKIYNNIFHQTGLAGEEPQNKGFQLGTNTVAQVFNNVISEANSQCAIVINTGKLEFRSNYLGDCGANAVYITNNAPQLIPPGASAVYQDNYLRKVGANRPFFFVNNRAYSITVSENTLSGGNREVDVDDTLGGNSRVNFVNNSRKVLPKIQFTKLPGGALCVAKGSFYDGKNLGPEVCE